MKDYDIFSKNICKSSKIIQAFATNLKKNPT